MNNIPQQPITVQTWKPIRYTATSDAKFQPVISDMVMNYADIYVFDNDCYLGDATDQDIDIAAGDIYHIESHINLKELIFKNKVAGSNTKIVITGVPMTRKQMIDKGVI